MMMLRHVQPFATPDAICVRFAMIISFITFMTFFQRAFADTLPMFSLIFSPPLLYADAFISFAATLRHFFYFSVPFDAALLISPIFVISSLPLFDADDFLLLSAITFAIISIFRRHCFSFSAEPSSIHVSLSLR